MPRLLERKSPGLWPLVMTIFFCVSGGPYGLEPIMQSGFGMGLLLILLTPFVWAIPSALMTAELSSALPAEGGYYVWVKRALGPSAGFFCAWFTYLYSCADLALYPVLLVSYLKSLSGFGHEYNFLIGLAMIIPLTWLNIRGVRVVGRTSFLFGILLLIPFAVMIVLTFVRHGSDFSYLHVRLIPQGSTIKGAFTAGLFVIMWNYLGWDSLSTITGELKNPQKLFPKALLIAVPLIILNYLLPAIAGISVWQQPEKWTDGAWTSIASAAGGHTLQLAIGIGAVLSMAGLFMAGLLANSRIPFVLADDGYLPSFLKKIHPKFGTPVTAILMSAAIYTLMSVFDFEQLAEIDVILYSTALLLEFISLFVLRLKEPALPRPFRIRGGLPALALIVLLPLSLIAFAYYSVFQEQGRSTLWILLAGLISGGILLLIKRLRNA
jgi:amino acid transporter